MASQRISTFCRICESRCGIDVTVDDGHITRISPDKANPYSWRDFCVRGRTASESLDHPRRLRQPLRRVGASYEAATWDYAIDDIATRLSTISERHGPDSIAFYFGNPTGFSGSNGMFMVGLAQAIGTRNVYSVASVDNNNVCVVSEEVFGSGLVPLVPDVDNCDFFLLLGMDPAVSEFGWIHNVPDGWRRVLRRQAAGAEVVVVDPRRSASAAAADLHVPVWPGEDWALLLGLVKLVIESGPPTELPAERYTGLAELEDLVATLELTDLARRCRIAPEVIAGMADHLSAAPAAMVVAHTGVAHTPTGTIAEWLTVVLNALTGNLDSAGGRFFQPGYHDSSRMFASVRSEPSRVRGLPTVLGARALAELADEILTPGVGRVRALFVNSGNPVVSGAQGERLDSALADLELLVGVDLMQRSSHRHADWILPAAHWLERRDLLLNYSSFEDRPFAQYGRQAVAPPPEVREEWELWLDLAVEMGIGFLGRELSDDQRRDRRRARVERRPELALHPATIQRAIVERGGRVSWDDLEASPHGVLYDQQSYGHIGAAIGHPDGRIRLAPTRIVAELRRQLAMTSALPPADFPLVLVNRRRVTSMNSWLNDLPSRRVKSNSLQMNPSDVAVLGLERAMTVQVESRVGSITLPLEVSDDVAPGTVVAEHGWGSALLDPSGTGTEQILGANRNVLVPDDELDPLSQTPAFNRVFVSVRAGS